jgi:hypothetical protein
MNVRHNFIMPLKETWYGIKARHWSPQRTLQPQWLDLCDRWCTEQCKSQKFLFCYVLIDSGPLTRTWTTMAWSYRFPAFTGMLPRISKRARWVWTWQFILDAYYGRGQYDIWGLDTQQFIVRIAQTYLYRYSIPEDSTGSSPAWERCPLFLSTRVWASNC